MPPVHSYNVYPIPDGFALSCDSWTYDKRGDHDWFSDEISRHPTLKEAEAAMAAWKARVGS